MERKISDMQEWKIIDLLAKIKLKIELVYNEDMQEREYDIIENETNFYGQYDGDTRLINTTEAYEDIQYLTDVLEELTNKLK